MYPNIETQELNSYKDFLKWFSKTYSNVQLSYCKRGQEPERLGLAPKFMDYNENSFNFVADIVFEYLPFEFQYGVFLTYFNLIGIDFDFTQHNKQSYIQQLFHDTTTKQTIASSI